MPAPALKALRFLLAAALAASPLGAEEPSWYLILLGGKRAGTQSERLLVGEGGTRRTELALRLTVSRFGEHFTIAQRQSWVEGEYLLSLDSETDLNGEPEFLSARAGEEGLRLVEWRSGGVSERTLQDTGPLLGPQGAADRLREALAGGQGSSGAPRELSFRQFSPETGAVQDVRCILLGAGELADSLGNLHRGQRVDQESSAAPGVTTAGVYDERGELQYSVTSAGLTLEVLRQAAAPAQASDLELFEMASLSIPVRWPPGSGVVPRIAALRAVTVRFTGAALPELEQAAQAVRADLGGRPYRRNGLSLVLTLAAPPPPPPWPAAGAAAEEHTGGGFYLDLEDPRLEELLASCGSAGFACLEALVDRTIRTKSLQHGFAGVGEVLDSRAGDCTEHALLLAALLRKRGLQSRIAYGFLLTEAGFIGHAWTEVRAGGRWFWLDPSFPGGRPYGCKLRLGVIDPARPVWGQLGVSLLAAAGGLQAEVLEQAYGR